MTVFQQALARYADFSGRETRPEFWCLILLSTAVAVAGVINDSAPLAAMFALMYGTAAVSLLVPGLTVGLRRLRATGKPGWLLVHATAPIAGLVLVYVLIQPVATLASP